MGVEFASHNIRLADLGCLEGGFAVEFHPVAGLSHYRYDGFMPALRKAVPWVKKVWEGK